MSEKTFYVHCRSFLHWTAIVKARSKEEAKEKALTGDHEDIIDEPLTPDFVTVSAEEVGE
jgi:hypothetical protein